MCKKIIACLLGVTLAFASLLPVYADEIDVDLLLEEDLPEAVQVISIADSIPSTSAVLMEQQTGQILYAQKADEPLPPASITKIMTLLLVMEALEKGKIGLDDMVASSEFAASMGGSQIWLKVGEEMSVDDLLKAVSIASANDASVALAEHVAGSEEAFIDMMNIRAQDLGMENTHFLNCTGLDEVGHVSTSRDVAVMSRELMKHPRISEYSTIWMDSLRAGETELVNTNRLVRFYNGCTGLKTGTTSGAGSCLSATATRDGLGLIAVVMGSPTSEERFSSARGLLDYGFANYTSVKPPSVDDQLIPVKVLRGVADQVQPVYESPSSFVVEKQNEDKLTQAVTLTEDILAPVEIGQIIGIVEVMVDGQLVGSYPLMAGDSIDRMTLGKAFVALFKGLMKMTSNPPPPLLGTHDPTVRSDPSVVIGDDVSQGDSEQSTAEVACSCGKDTCYCKQIGDICGCTKS